jgi:hypothetical protein
MGFLRSTPGAISSFSFWQTLRIHFHRATSPVLCSPELPLVFQPAIVQVIKNFYYQIDLTFGEALPRAHTMSMVLLEEFLPDRNGEFLLHVHTILGDLFQIQSLYFPFSMITCLSILCKNSMQPKAQSHIRDVISYLQEQPLSYQKHSVQELVYRN